MATNVAHAGTGRTAQLGPSSPVPQTVMTSAPTGQVALVPLHFAFKSSISRSTFKCRIDDQRSKSCASPMTLRLDPGKHTVRIRAISPAGAADPTPAVARFQVLRKGGAGTPPVA